MVNKEIEQQIKALFIKSDKSDVDVNEMIAKKEKEIKLQKPNLSDDKIGELVYKFFFVSRKKEITDVGGTEIKMIAYYAQSSFDWVSSKKKAITDKIKKDGIKKAVAEGYCEVPEWNPDGSPAKTIPLYYWDNNKQGMPSQMKGKPLPEESWMRSYGGIASRDGKVWKKFKGMINNDLANPKSQDYREILINTPILANISVKSETESTFNIESRSSSYFNKIDKSLKNFEVGEDQLLEMYAEDYLPVKDLSTWFENNIEWTGDDKHSRGNRNVKCTKCTVIAIDPPVKDTSARLYVDDPKRGLYDDKGNKLVPFLVWVPKGMEINFGIGSELFIWFEIRQNEKKQVSGNNTNWMGEWDQINLNMDGFTILYLEEKEVTTIKSDKTPVSNAPFIPSVDDLKNIPKSGEVKPNISQSVPKVDTLGSIINNSDLFDSLMEKVQPKTQDQLNEAMVKPSQPSTFNKNPVIKAPEVKQPEPIKQPEIVNTSPEIKPIESTGDQKEAKKKKSTKKDAKDLDKIEV